jgi:hypothetical protein
VKLSRALSDGIGRLGLDGSSVTVARQFPIFSRTGSSAGGTSEAQLGQRPHGREEKVPSHACDFVECAAFREPRPQRRIRPLIAGSGQSKGGPSLFSLGVNALDLATCDNAGRPVVWEKKTYVSNICASFRYTLWAREG